MRQRTALAGHVDQVVGTAQQAEFAARAACMAGVLQHQHVGQCRGLGHVPARDDETFTVAAAFGVDAQVAQRGPDFALRGAAAGHLAGLGAAVDFHQQPVQRSFCLQRQLRRQRRGGRQRQRRGRQRHAGQQQCFQVERRGHQPAGSRHARQRACHVGRVERPASVEGGAAQQRQQHGALQAVAVLRRHGGHHRQPRQAGRAQVFGQTGGFGGDVDGQRAEALAVRLRRAGGPRREQAHGFQLSGNVRHHGGVGALQRIGVHHHSGQTTQVQAAGSGRAIGSPGAVDQRVQRRAVRAGVGLHLAQRLGQGVRQHQAGVAAQQCCGQAQREAVAVLAQVHRQAPGRQQLGQQLRLSNEAASADRLPGAPGQRCSQVARGQQRQRQRERDRERHWQAHWQAYWHGQWQAYWQGRWQAHWQGQWPARWQAHWRSQRLACHACIAPRIDRRSNSGCQR